MAGRAARRRRETIGQVTFARTKYGRELLVDAAMLSGLPAFSPTPQPHRLAYHDILLVTEGRGTFWLDGVPHAIVPGVVFFTRPGDIRRWAVERVDGACLLFTREFVEDAFSDPRFLEALSYFRPERPSGALTLGAADRREFLRRFRTMTREIRELRRDAPHLLRAVLYELLIRLDRWYRARHDAAPAPTGHRAIERFTALVERDFARTHRVHAYARALGLTPGHLNALCRTHLGATASAIIRRRLVLEARRRLLHTTQPAFAIARDLGFPDPSYFGRFYRRETGATPRQARQGPHRA